MSSTNTGSSRKRGAYSLKKDESINFEEGVTHEWRNNKYRRGAYRGESGDSEEKVKRGPYRGKEHYCSQSSKKRQDIVNVIRIQTLSQTLMRRHVERSKKFKVIATRHPRYVFVYLKTPTQLTRIKTAQGARALSILT